MPPKNANMSAARSAKNDEFYTRLEDIEREMAHYRDHFRDKTVFLNCDDPEESNFWRYFELNFDFLGLRKLISTHYDAEKPTYKLEITRGDDRNGDGTIDGRDLVKTPLAGNGDFRSPEAVALLQESDIVVTNPPFSLFREYIAQLVEHEKDFIVLGNMNAITYKETWTHIQSGRMWLGSMPSFMAFRVPDDSEPRATRYWEDEDGKWRSLGNACWFTTLDHARRHEEIVLFREYDPKVYPRYDNYDAIEVSRVADIPVDYTLQRVVSDAELAELRSRGFVVTDRPTDRPTGFSLRSDRESVHGSADHVPGQAQPGSVRDRGVREEHTRPGLGEAPPPEGSQPTVRRRCSEVRSDHGSTRKRTVRIDNPIMGVPITFLGKHNPDQFEIVGQSANGSTPDYTKLPHFKRHNEPYISDKKVYQRVFIRRNHA